MSHGLIQNGIFADNMVYHGEMPWHKLGKAVAHPLTPAEALRESGADFEIQEFPLIINDLHYAGQKALAGLKWISEDKGENFPLAIVGEKYEAFQNSALAETLTEIYGNVQCVETAGTLWGGRECYFLVRSDSVEIQPGDTVKTYHFWHQSHDGRFSQSGIATSVRVVCNNTATMARKEGVKFFNLRHTSNFQVRKQLQVAALRGLQELEAETLTVWKGFAQATISIDGASKALETLIAGESTRVKNVREEIMSLFRNGKGNDGKTKWDLFNGVTEYVSHKRPTRVEGAKGMSNAEYELEAGKLTFESVMYGSGAELTAKAQSVIAAI